MARPGWQEQTAFGGGFEGFGGTAEAGPADPAEKPGWTGARRRNSGRLEQGYSLLDGLHYLDVPQGSGIRF